MEAGEMAAAQLMEEETLSPATRILFMAISTGLVLMAGLMSGLTIGLLAMDDIELEVLKRGGTDSEKKYAAAIAPLLAKGHLLLCTLVVWNAACMEALPIFLDRLADPVTAILISVSVVLIFGEIVPQSICTRYGLAVGYYTSWLVRVLMVISYPIAWPLGRLLDKILGHGDATLPRGQLQHYVTLHGEAEGFAPLGQGLTDNELHVINSALELTYKRAKAAMTPLDTVFMVSSDDVLNEALVARILATGHSRVPVFSGRDRSNVVGLLLVKELLLKESVRVGDLPMRSMPSLSASMPMYDVLHLFKIGRAHMALLREASPEQVEARRAALTKEDSATSRMLHLSPATFDNDADVPLLSSERRASAEAAGIAAEDVSEMYINVTEGTVVGIITIEDVIEELIGDEIIDETDRWENNLQTARVNAATLAERLPPNLRTLLSMGMFMPRVHPGRPRPRPTGTPFMDDAPPDDASPPRVWADGVGGSSTAQSPSGGLTRRSAAQRSRSMRSVRSELSAAPPSTGDVAEAYRKVEAHLADPGVAEAVDVLRDAVASPLPLRRTASAAKPGSFFASRAGRTHAVQAKERAAAVAEQLQEQGDV